MLGHAWNVGISPCSKRRVPGVTVCRTAFCGSSAGFAADNVLNEGKDFRSGLNSVMALNPLRVSRARCIVEVPLCDEYHNLP
jgi:hypothetical protein